MSNLPRGFRPKASSGVSFIKVCADCAVRPEYVQGEVCPALSLMKEAGIRLFRKADYPTDAQNTTEWAASLHHSMQQRAKKIGCEGKRLFMTADKEFADMMRKESK